MLKTQAWGPDTHPGVMLHVLLDDADPETPSECFEAALARGRVTPCAPREVAPGVFTTGQVTGDDPVYDLVDGALVELDLPLGQVVTGAEAQEIYDAVLAENRRKNEAEALIISLLPPSMMRAVIDEDGDDTGQVVVKAKHRPVWTFGAADGRVSFTVPGADDDTKAALRAALAEQFGDYVTLD